MRHLGDIRRVNGADIEPVDSIIFGSPCQDLSVAGRQAGLKHESKGDAETTRSGLFMEAVRIIKEMRLRTNGLYPRFILWENVPGAFSANKGEDFRTVLEQLIKIIEPGAVMPEVPKNGWPYADSYRGNGWSLAYRVFDAQHWGVPQRRRRIHLVVDFRGESAGKILFERDGVRGYFTQSRAQRKGPSSYAERSFVADDKKGFDGYNGELTGDRAATLGVNCGVSTGRNGVIERGRQLDGLKTGQNEQAFIYSFDSLSSNSMKSENPYSGCRSVCISKTLDCGTPDPGKNQGGIAILQKVICLQGNGIDRADTAGCNGKGWKEDKSYTLNTIDRPAIVYGIGNGQANQTIAEEVSGSLTCTHDQQMVCYNGENITSPTNAANPQFADPCHCISTDSRNILVNADTFVVRRLTPTECARLQGFPDDWGHFEKKDEFTEEELRFWIEVRNTHAAINGRKTRKYTEKQMLGWYNKLHTDSAEYKMWGNGIALPPALYCLQGIAEVLNREEDDTWMF